MVGGLVLKDLKNWPDRGLVHWHGEQLKVYQKRLYSLRSVVEAYALNAMQKADVPLAPHGIKFAEVMVKQSVLVYAFGWSEGEFRMAGRYALANETVGELMRDLPLWNFSWELRVFTVDYALAKLLDGHLSDRSTNAGAVRARHQAGPRLWQCRPRISEPAV